VFVAPGNAGTADNGKISNSGKTQKNTIFKFDNSTSKLFYSLI